MKTSSQMLIALAILILLIIGGMGLYLYMNKKVMVLPTPMPTEAVMSATPLAPVTTFLPIVESPVVTPANPFAEPSPAYNNPFNDQTGYTNPFSSL